MYSNHVVYFSLMKYFEFIDVNQIVLHRLRGFTMDKGMKHEWEKYAA